MREVLVHYHLFKNAGSTVDRILSRHFGTAWDRVEADRPWESLSPSRFADFVRSRPALSAISSHQARMPAPEVMGVAFHPLFFLRDPLDRAGSVYAFERIQSAGSSPGVDKARDSTFREYVEWRLEEGDGGVICNFQASCLGWRAGEPGGRQMLERAKQVVATTACVGLVDRFEESMCRIALLLEPHFGKIDIRQPAQNRSPGRAGSLRERIEMLQSDLGEDCLGRLIEANRLDAELHRFASERFEAPEPPAVAA